MAGPVARNINIRCRAWISLELNTWAPKVEAKLRTLPEIVDVNSDQQDRGQQSLVVFDRTTASRLGLSPQLIDDTLYDAFGQRQVSIMYTRSNQYHVVMEVAPQYWQNRPRYMKFMFDPRAVLRCR